MKNYLSQFQPFQIGLNPKKGNSMEDNQIDRIFIGSFEALPMIKHPLVRIYMSSTYTDMTLEKTLLVSEVYPKLKEYCRERYGLEFQV